MCDFQTMDEDTDYEEEVDQGWVINEENNNQNAEVFTNFYESFEFVYLIYFLISFQFDSTSFNHQ